MHPYAQHPAVRLQQIFADLGMLAWVVVWVLVARTAHAAVLVLAEPGRAVEDLGRSVAGNMNSAADAAQSVPLVGDELSKPFGALSNAGGLVSGAGRSAQDAVHTLATVVAVVLVVLPVAWLLFRWLPWRLRYAREAGAARRLLAGTPDLEILAARALATAPLPRLAALPPGTGTAWHSGDPVALRALASLELSRLGLRLPAGGAVTSSASSPPPR